MGGRVKLNSPDAAKVNHFIVRWSGLFVVLGITLPIELQPVFVGVGIGFAEGQRIQLTRIWAERMKQRSIKFLVH